MFSFIDFYFDTGLFGVYCGVEKSNIKKSLNFIKEEFEDLIRNDVPEEELERLKKETGKP